MELCKSSRRWSPIIELWSSYIFRGLSLSAFNTTKQNEANFHSTKISPHDFHFLPLFSTCTCRHTVLQFTWASCQVRKIAGAHAPKMSGAFSPPSRISDPDMHHGTCVMHVPWWMPKSLTSGFLWNRQRRETFRHSQRMHNPEFFVSGKRPMDTDNWKLLSHLGSVSLTGFHRKSISGWKFRFTLTSILTKWPLQNFVHGTKAALS